jgi:hypothetical protein
MKSTILKKQLLELVLIRWKIKKVDKNWLGNCITCGHWGHWTTMSGWHFIPTVKWLACKFELDNVNLQCQWCNSKCNQGEQYKHGLYINREFWEWRAEELHRQANTTRKRKVYELEEAIDVVERCIIDRWDNQNSIQQQILIYYITKNNNRKQKCKHILSIISPKQVKDRKSGNI